MNTNANGGQHFGSTLKFRNAPLGEVFSLLLRMGETPKLFIAKRIRAEFEHITLYLQIYSSRSEN